MAFWPRGWQVALQVRVQQGQVMYSVKSEKFIWGECVGLTLLPFAPRPDLLLAAEVSLGSSPEPGHGEPDYARLGQQEPGHSEPPWMLSQCRGDTGR